MKIEDILKSLNVEKLDESQQASIKEKLENIIDVKARERADSILEEEKKTLVTEYETKFDDYKKDITSKFSNFVDSVLDEELQIPEKVLKYAKLGENYTDLIEQFKIKLAIDEDVLTGEVKNLLKEAKDEIVKTRDELNKVLAEKLTLEEDAKEMAAHIYLRKKCDGLTESQKSKVMSILGDLKNTKEIDKKFDILVEELEPGTETPPAEATTNANICPKCGAVATPKGEEIIINCPVCGAKMKDAADVIPAEEMGQGTTQLTDPPEINGEADVPAKKVMEEKNWLDNNKASWLKVLKENKI
jgi:rubrerythrin